MHMQEQRRQRIYLVQSQAKIASTLDQREQQMDRFCPWPHTREIYAELLQRQFYHSRPDTDVNIDFIS